VALMSIYAIPGKPSIAERVMALTVPRTFRPQDRQSAGRCLARDVAGVRQAAGIAPDAVNFVNVGPNRQDRGR